MARQEADTTVKQYREAQTLRSHLEHDWRVASAHCLPMHYNAWQTSGPASYKGGTEAARRVAFDTTGARSLPKYVSILERLATPIGQKWHGLAPSIPSLKKNQRVRAYFDELQGLLFKMRYNPRARFRSTTNEMYTSMGVYGNGPVFIGKRTAKTRNEKNGFKYVSCPMRDIFFLVDDDGEIAIVFRRFWLNVRQFRVKFPEAPIPASMANEAGKVNPSESAFFEFVHYVCPRGEDYDPQAIDARRHPYSGSYMSVEKPEYIGDETGYQSLPYKIPRTATVSGDAYGYSPAITALAALGGASQMKKTNLKQGNRAVDPVLLSYDDGVLNGEVDLRPGAINPGGVDSQGRKLIQALDTGDFRVAEMLLQDERTDVEDSFFVTLFQILNDTPEMTATEVMERVAEKASLLSPTMGRLQSEFLGPTIEREIDLLSEMGMLPEMPPELEEAEGEYEVVYTSPMAKGMYAEEVSGFMRSVEMALNVARETRDEAHLDHFNFEEALPEIADAMATPARWLNDEKTKEAKRKTRADSQQEAMMMQNAQGLATAAKTVNDMENPSE